ncbi:hypothetical protein [Paraburkholderia hospita]|uniref:hypothetical protein n=1 Tax=Paraburkholderia hospita TaxID=169430 RepID=UPI0012601CB9|nr:hypothetical protein [Paraburkholderia hospita]
MAFAYRDPDAILATIMPTPVPRNAHGHTPLEDFEHFCMYTGLSANQAGSAAVAWARLAYVTEWLNENAATP